MKSKRILTATGVALIVAMSTTSASAFQVRGGAQTSVNRANMASSHDTNVATRQANRTTREGNRQNTAQQVSSNRTNAAQNISNNRANVANNYNDNHGGCCYNGGWYNDHPVATAAAVTGAVVATAAVVGSIVHTLPPSCSAINVNGVTYQQCGSTYYQPQYSGTTVQYIVVNPPH
ncbi:MULTISPECIES: DUF6515 family protein [unclassified Paraburkholderia]|uniref:DUF6515 family protein n=1 Tax=unclassified Paraburkholderia TaxID=2615204 RepID=UPI00197EEFCC|nr:MULTISPECIES: DUF6515 family protein [unclassified Paraburkholderia]MBN3858644.1 hypothetical protein [Paraburkholderia sp. Ac-20340]